MERDKVADNMKKCSSKIILIAVFLIFATPYVAAVLEGNVTLGSVAYGDWNQSIAIDIGIREAVIIPILSIMSIILYPIFLSSMLAYYSINLNKQNQGILSILFLMATLFMLTISLGVFYQIAFAADAGTNVLNLIISSITIYLPLLYILFSVLFIGITILLFRTAKKNLGQKSKENGKDKSYFPKWSFK